MKRFTAIFLLLTGLSAGILLSCSKEELEPSSETVIIMYFKGLLGAQPFYFATDKGFLADTYVSSLDTMAREYTFVFADTSLTSEFAFASLNFRSPLMAVEVSLEQDLDTTFRPRAFSMMQMFGNPANPFQLGTFACEITTLSGETYSSLTFNGITNGYAVVDSSRDITWIDQKTYKLVYLSLDFEMMLKDSSLVAVTNSSALIAFPKN